MDRNELYHHGILGQKWGRRRYQNKDGSLTPEGRKRQAAMDARNERQREAIRNRVRKSRNPKDVYDNADLFTTDELRTMYNRLSLEKSIRDLTPRDAKAGKSKLDRAIDLGVKVESAAAVGTKLYNHMARYHNTFSKDSEKWKVIKNNDGEDKKKNK